MGTRRSSAFGLRSSTYGLRSSVTGLRSSVFKLRSSVCGLRASVFGLRPSLADGIRESQRRKTRGLETLHTGINSLSLLARFNQFVTAGHHDPILQHDEADALDEAVSILKSVVLPALQERVPDDTEHVHVHVHVRVHGQGTTNNHAADNNTSRREPLWCPHGPRKIYPWHGASTTLHDWVH